MTNAGAGLEGGEPDVLMKAAKRVKVSTKQRRLLGIGTTIPRPFPLCAPEIEKTNCKAMVWVS